MNEYYFKMNSEIVICNKKNVENIRRHAKLLTLFLRETSKLTESYILDYFVEKLWTRLPACWLDTVMKFESHDLALFLNSEKEISYKSPWPLSLLAFRASAFSLALPRKPVKSLKCVENFISENFKVNPSKKINWDNLDSAYDVRSGQHKKIPEFCRRHVKPKKQHEIFCMGQLASTVLESLDVKHAIDIGSGQGHLSRYLALCHKLCVVTIEAETTHVTSAESFDKQAFSNMKSRKDNEKSCRNAKTSKDDDLILPHHLEGCMTSESSRDFLKKIFEKSNVDDSCNNDFEVSFALLGLHTCGDLATTILKIFAECHRSMVVLSAGCCYMKLSSNLCNKGYPLSSYVKSLSYHHLSYEAKEMACHALEMYIQRLKDNAPSLKIHCYRAVLEKCIVHHYPDCKHMGLRGVKNAELLDFSEYAEKALNKVSCKIPKEFYSLPDIQSCLNQWKQVLIFYSLRLMIAPVVESLILLDRMLYLFESGYPSCIVPLFDPSLSPRNQILVSACTNVNNL